MVCKGRKIEQMQNKRQDGDTVRVEDAQRQLSWSWLSFLMSEDILLLPLGPFNRLPISFNEFEWVLHYLQEKEIHKDME